MSIHMQFLCSCKCQPMHCTCMSHVNNVCNFQIMYVIQLLSKANVDFLKIFPKSVPSQIRQQWYRQQTISFCATISTYRNCLLYNVVDTVVHHAVLNEVLNVNSLFLSTLLYMYILILMRPLCLNRLSMCFT